MDAARQQVYIENTLQGGSYWTVSFGTFVRAWVLPETTASIVPDPAIVKRLHDEVVAILGLEDMKERIKTLGFDMIASTPDAFGAQVKNDVMRWSEVVKRANVPMN